MPIGTSLLRKSFRDLSRRKARTVLTILTIACGIGGLGMFAVPPLMDKAMFDEIENATPAVEPAPKRTQQVKEVRRGEAPKSTRDTRRQAKGYR